MEAVTFDLAQTLTDGNICLCSLTAWLLNIIKLFHCAGGDKDARCNWHINYQWKETSHWLKGWGWVLQLR